MAAMKKWSYQMGDLYFAHQKSGLIRGVSFGERGTTVLPQMTTEVIQISLWIVKKKQLLYLNLSEVIFISEKETIAIDR
jgi:hypothetical protein